MLFLKSILLKICNTIPIGLITLYGGYYIKLLLDPSRTGPIPLPFIGNLLFYLREEKIKDKLSILKKYYEDYGKLWITYLPNGRFFRLEKIINITEPDDVKHILKTNFDDYEKGKIQSEIFNDLLGNGIFNTDGCPWSKQRKIASHKFSQNNIKNYMLQIFIKHAQTYTNNLKKNKVYDFQVIAHNYTLDSICEIGMGINLKEIECNNHKFGKSLDIVQHLIQRRFIDPFWKIKRELNIGNEKKICDNIEIIDNYIYKTIDKRLKTNYETLPDILSQFMKISKNQYYLRNVITNFLIAGRDTTATALTWCMYCLCKHPLHYPKLREEINHHFGKDETINIDDINFVTIKKLKYLNGFISEVLRLYPPVPIDTKVCVKDNILPSGYKVKAGNRIFYHPYLMGNIESIWTKSSELSPYRWINQTYTDQHNQYKFPTFNAGKRLCLGKDMAYLEITVFLIFLIKEFNFELLSTSIHQHMRITLKIEDGLMIKYV